MLHCNITNWQASCTFKIRFITSVWYFYKFTLLYVFKTIHAPSTRNSFDGKSVNSKLIPFLIISKDQLSFGKSLHSGFSYGIGRGIGGWSCCCCCCCFCCRAFTNNWTDQCWKKKLLRRMNSLKLITIYW